MTAPPTIAQLSISPEQRVTSKPRYIGYVMLLTSAILTAIYIASSTSSNNTPNNQYVKATPTLSEEERVSTPKLTKVKTPQVAKTPAASTTDQAGSVLDASGHIVARRIATVSSQVTGKLNILLIEEGQQVKAAQIMAQLDDEQAKISFALAKAQVSAVKAALAELDIQQSYELKRRDRQLQLAQNDLLSQQHLDDISQNIDRIAVNIQSQQAQLELAQHKVALAKYTLSQHQIKAPFDGIVISKNAQVGELISAGNSGGSIRTGVGTIVDMSSLEIEVEVGEGYINRVYAGQQTVAVLDAYPEWSIKSEVITVIPTADRQKASIKVRIKLLDKDQRILPDMGVKVSFYS